MRSLCLAEFIHQHGIEVACSHIFKKWKSYFILVICVGLSET